MRLVARQRLSNSRLKSQYCRLEGLLVAHLLFASICISLPSISQERITHPSSLDLPQPKVVRFAWPEGFSALLPPVISKTSAVGLSADGSIVAMSTENGAILWKNKLKDPLAASPSCLIAGDKIYVLGAEGTIFAISLNTGDTRALGTFNQQIRLLAVDRHALYLYDTQAATLRAIKLKDARNLWQYTIGPDLCFTDGSPAKVSGDDLFVVLHRADPQGRRIAGRLICLDSASGRRKWTFDSNRVWDIPPEVSTDSIFIVADKGVAASSEPAARDGQSTGGAQATLFALDLRTGAPTWDSQAVSHSPVYMGAKFRNGILFYEDGDFRLRALRWPQRTLLWECRAVCSTGDVLASNGIGISKDMIYWSPCEKLLGVSLDSGKIVWMLNSPGTITEPVAQKGKATFGLPSGILVVWG